jgi:hypothetical protein
MKHGLLLVLIGVVLQTSVATAQTSKPEWTAILYTLTTNSYCFTPDKARVRETTSQFSLVESGGPWIYWTVPKAADGSVKDAEVVGNSASSPTGGASTCPPAVG